MKRFLATRTKLQWAMFGTWVLVIGAFVGADVAREHYAEAAMQTVTQLAIFAFGAWLGNRT